MRKPILFNHDARQVLGSVDGGGNIEFDTPIDINNLRLDCGITITEIEKTNGVILVKRAKIDLMSLIPDDIGAHEVQPETKEIFDSRKLLNKRQDVIIEDLERLSDGQGESGSGDSAAMLDREET